MSKENLKNQGFLTPQAIDLEEAVLGVLLIEENAFHIASGIVSNESFYKEKHRIIYKAIQKLQRDSSPVDILTVTAQLRKEGTLEMVGGAFYITELTNRVASGSNVEYYAAIIQQKYLQREIISICQEHINKAFSDETDVFDLYDGLSSEIFKRVSMGVGKQAVKIADVIAGRIKHYEKPKNGNSDLTGISSGFKDVDRITGGWQNTDLIILAARPGMGKTAFALNLVRAAARTKAVAIFSLEQSKEQITDRMISSETEIYHDKLKKRDLTDMDWRKISTMNQLINSSIFIDDSSAMPIATMRSKAMHLKQKHDLGLIVVDYLQLMRGEKDVARGNREQEIGSISRGLKAMAKDLDLPVIALSQLSRALENRPGVSGKVPMLSDLRESGSIEQDADQVMFLYRPEYYGYEQDEDGNPTKGKASVIFAKNRHGSTDEATLNFVGKYMKFVDLENESAVVESQFLSLSPSTQFEEITLSPSTKNGDIPF